MVQKFNKTKPSPDVQMEDWHLWAQQHDDMARTELGYRRIGDNVNDFLQKQVPNILLSIFVFFSQLIFFRLI